MHSNPCVAISKTLLELGTSCFHIPRYRHNSRLMLQYYVGKTVFCSNTEINMILIELLAAVSI